MAISIIMFCFQKGTLYIFFYKKSLIVIFMPKIAEQKSIFFPWIVTVCNLKIFIWSLSVCKYAICIHSFLNEVCNSVTVFPCSFSNLKNLLKHCIIGIHRTKCNLMFLFMFCNFHYNPLLLTWPLLCGSLSTAPLSCF